MLASCTKACSISEGKKRRKQNKVLLLFFQVFQALLAVCCTCLAGLGFWLLCLDALEGALEECVEEMSDGLPNVLSKRIKCHVQNIKAHAKYTHNTHNIVCPIPSSPLFFSAPLPLPFWDCPSVISCLWVGNVIIIICYVFDFPLSLDGNVVSVGFGVGFVYVLCMLLVFVLCVWLFFFKLEFVLTYRSLNIVDGCSSLRALFLVVCWILKYCLPIVSWFTSNISFFSLCSMMAV